LKDTFLQLINFTEGKKKQVRLKAYCVCQMKLEGTQYKLTTEIAQKSRDSMLLARVRDDERAEMQLLPARPKTFTNV
jgi:hypothetical protein